jgi:cell division protein FtsI (penicillin-binding protein 3)
MHLSEIAQRRNRVVVDSYEPGSTMKSFALAASLKYDLLTPNKKYFCEDGKMQLGRRVIREADSRHKFGWLTASEILAFSSNIGTTKIALEMGAAPFFESLKSFGFGQTTGVAFPGEAKGIMHATPWSDHLLSNISFGHGITTTPIQLVAAYAAIARDGIWTTPKLLRSIQSVSVEELNSTFPVAERRVLTERQAATMRLMLTTATSLGGTGTGARVAGYPVAGKTGTAQKVNPNGRGYLPGSYISSFAGMIPAQSPKFVIYIAVDNPRKQYYGSMVAAPVFAKVATAALRSIEMMPMIISQGDGLAEPPLSERAKQKSTSRTWHHVPKMQGLTLREAYSFLDKNNAQIQFQGHGRVSSTEPPAGSSWPEDDKIKLILTE